MSHAGNWKEIEITKDLTIPKLFSASRKKILGQKSGHAGEGVWNLDPHHLETIL